MVYTSIPGPFAPIQYRNGAFVLALDTLRLQSRNCLTALRRLCCGAFQQGLLNQVPPK